MVAIPEVGPMSDEEAKQFLEKYFGGSYEEYQKSLKDLPLTKRAPAPIQKSAAELFVDYCKGRAASMGISLEKLFSDDPKLYQKYRELSYGQDQEV